jgi:hypothetical protein
MRIKNSESALEVWKWALHEDTLFHSRSIIFIAIQALLFAGLNVTYEDTVALKYVFIIAGVCTSFLWFVAMQRQENTINQIKEKLRAYGNDHQDSFLCVYSEIARSRITNFLPSLNQLIGLILPSGFLLAWIAVSALH